MMTLLEYQALAQETREPADNGVAATVESLLGSDWSEHERGKRLYRLLRVNYALSGLSNEAGECTGKLKKMYRDREGHIDDEWRQMITAELGDVLWYLADTCTTLGLSLNEVAKGNVAKLRDRKKRGVLQGDGDTR